MERAVEPTSKNLFLAFDDIEQNTQKAISLGQKIVTKLKDQGFTVDWNGTIEQRIEIKNISWQKIPDGQPWGITRAIEYLHKSGGNAITNQTMKETMEEIIQKLDKHLATLRPEFYLELNEPLNDDQLDKLEEYYKQKMPKDLRTLYKWKNGQNANCYESFVNNSMFIPLHQALYDASELTSMIGTDFEIENWWNEKWIPIFQNGGGDNICYDLDGTFTGQQGQLIEFWHADNDRNAIAPSLEAFISKLIDYYETKQKDDFDEYFKIENINEYPKKFIVE